ncbi:MAG: radical SAM protein, partial [Candidatus Babeliales bacterium]
MFKSTYPEHIYIHWPFCTSKCVYCDFISFQDHAGFETDYHKALCSEISVWASTLDATTTKPVLTIFIGGGTPSLYPLPLMADLFSTLRSSFDCSQLKEVTIECNPSDITEERLDAWVSLGINRISMGVQILDDRILELLNRKQRIRDVEKALSMIPKYFSNISIDLILGLPGVTKDTWFSTIETVL